MKHLKVALTFGLVIGVLIISFFVSVYLAEKAKKSEMQSSGVAQNGKYNIENKEFGYSFSISEKLFAGYQAITNDFGTGYYIPAETEDYGLPLSPVFGIAAIPKDIAEKFEKICEQSRETVPSQCLYNPKLSSGQNNLFYFFVEGSQSTELVTATDEATQARYSEKLESIMSEVKQTLKYSDVASLPEYLPKQDNNDGFKYLYPTELNTLRLGEENQVLNLPVSLNLAESVVKGGGNAVKKVLPIKHCAASGICKNTTENFIIDVQSLRNISEDQLLNSGIGSSLTKLQVAGYTTYQYNEGAEGEGINYHFIISPNEKQILVVIHRYIDETVLLNYKNTKDFTSYAKQKSIVNNLIDSLEFSEPWYKID